MPPHETPAASDDGPKPSPGLHYWPIMLAGVFVYYYGYSFVTLPFADEFWFGEIAPLALVQLPKMQLYDVVHDFLISLLPGLGLASGSPSPDMILTHPWALGITVSLPAVIVLTALILLPRVAYRRWLILAVMVVAALDAGVTFWFDATSRLSIF